MENDNTPAAPPKPPQANGGKQRKAIGKPISEVERTLKTMDTLPPLVMTDQITPAVCNAVMGVLKTKLSFHQAKPEASKSDTSVPAGLKDAIRERPDLLNFLASWMSEEQLLELVDDDDETDGGT